MLALWFSSAPRRPARLSAACSSTWRSSARCAPTCCRLVLHPASARECGGLERPYRSLLGVPGAVATITIAFLTLVFQLANPTYREGVIGVALWFALGTMYFALRGRHRLVPSPEGEAARGAGRRCPCPTSAPASKERAKTVAPRRPSFSCGGRDMAGNLTLEELKNAVAGGEIDTVVVCIADMQGRLIGKRFQAEYLRRRRA